jgi:hypothetical protein
MTRVCGASIDQSLHKRLQANHIERAMLEIGHQEIGPGLRSFFSILVGQLAYPGVIQILARFEQFDTSVYSFGH